jgi:hypothetical protein
MWKKREHFFSSLKYVFRLFLSISRKFSPFVSFRFQFSTSNFQNGLAKTIFSSRLRGLCDSGELVFLIAQRHQSSREKHSENLNLRFCCEEGKCDPRIVGGNFTFFSFPREKIRRVEATEFQNIFGPPKCYFHLLSEEKPWSFDTVDMKENVPNDLKLTQ